MEWFREGIKLMAVGMGTVFLFLIVMVWVINLVAKLVKPFQHLLEEAAAPAPKPAAAPASEDGGLVAAITAAISKFRSEKNK